MRNLIIFLLFVILFTNCKKQVNCGCKSPTEKTLTNKNCFILHEVFTNYDEWQIIIEESNSISWVGYVCNTKNSIYKNVINGITETNKKIPIKITANVKKTCREIISIGNIYNDLEIISITRE